MGSKIKGWHQKAPRKDTKRMGEDRVGRKAKDRDRQDRKLDNHKRVDYSRLTDQDS